LGVAVLPVGPTKRQSNVYDGVPPVAVAMNRHDTLPTFRAMQGVFSTLKDPASAGMLVVVVDVVAVDVVVVVATVLVVVDVVAIEDVVVVIPLGPVPPPPQPAPARMIAAITAARPCACHGNPRVPDGAIICPPSESVAYCSK
jgi:hypothetical protein